MFSDAFSKDHQLIRADPKHSLYLACALMVRGNVQVSDLRRNIERSEYTLLTQASPTVSGNTDIKINKARVRNHFFSKTITDTNTLFKKSLQTLFQSLISPL